MHNVEKILQSSGMTLEETLSIKEDRAVLRVQRADTGSFILRVYQKEVAAYRELERSWCEGFPQVYRTYEEEGLFVVEEEDVEGISLQEHLKQAGKLPEKEALELMLQLCSSLQFLHRLGYIHRDVKPEHILLTPEKKAVLIDLDASMLVRPEKNNDTMLIGTVLYAAPEQFGLTRSDVRSDVYALGILLNEMLTGTHPTVKQYREGPLGDVIERCIRMNLEERYQSVEELEAALSHAAKSFRPTAKLSIKKVVLGVMITCILIASAFFEAGGSLHEAPEQPEPLAEVIDDTDPSEWLQLYRYDSMEPFATHFKTGGYSVRFYTGDGTLVDNTYSVYADEEIGKVTEWIPEEQAWGITSQGCDAGNSGYLHAVKDGNHYALYVEVMGEAMSAYTKVPDIRDYMDGYLKPENIPQIPGPYVVEYTYDRNQPLTLYLVAMPGMDHLEVLCKSSLVTIRPYEEEKNWQSPVYELTFENPEGGDAFIEVRSNLNPITFYLREK